MIPSLHLTKDDGDLPDDLEKYMQLVGKLNYHTVTRSDIAYLISVASQFVCTYSQTLGGFETDFVLFKRCHKTRHSI